MDVQSTDQHTVKPWFLGRADFAPRVVDSSGFPLLGARLAYVEGHTAAALVYVRRKHVINLFMWRDTDQIDHGEPATAARLAGYTLLHRTGDGLSFWAVSDVAPAEPTAIRAAFIAQ